MSVPLFGKISDIYGRKLMLQITIVTFLVGSILAGIAQTMLQLILARGVQGVGGGGILAMSFTILGDILTPRQRGKYAGYFTGVFASASVIGPLVGGFFVDHLTWRWVFFINLPLGVLSMVAVARYLHVPVPSERRAIDYLGAVLLTVGVTALLLASAWGGQEYAWGSPEIIGLVVTGAVLHGRLRDPGTAGEGADPAAASVRRPHLHRLRVDRRPARRRSSSADRRSCRCTSRSSRARRRRRRVCCSCPMMAGVVVGSNVCGRLVNHTGRYKVFPIIGTALAVIGILVLTVIDVDTERWLVSVGMGILGLGVGASMPIMTLAVQNTAPSGRHGRGDVGDQLLPVARQRLRRRRVRDGA